jgi:hypothetical protein
MGGRKSGADQRHSKNGDGTALTAHRTTSGPDIQDMHGGRFRKHPHGFKIFFLIEISSDCFQYLFLNIFKIPGSLITDSLQLRLQFSAQVALGNAPPPRHVSAPAGKGHFGASVSDDWSAPLRAQTSSPLLLSFSIRASFWITTGLDGTP